MLTHTHKQSKLSYRKPDENVCCRATIKHHYNITSSGSMMCKSIFRNEITWISWGRGERLSCGVRERTNAPLPAFIGTKIRDSFSEPSLEENHLWIFKMLWIGRVCLCFCYSWKGFCFAWDLPQSNKYTHTHITLFCYNENLFSLLFPYRFISFRWYKTSLICWTRTRCDNKNQFSLDVFTYSLCLSFIFNATKPWTFTSKTATAHT